MEIVSCALCGNGCKEGITGENNVLWSVFVYPIEPDPKATAGIGRPARETLILFASGFSLFTHQQIFFFHVASFTENAVVPSGNKEKECFNFLSIGKGTFFSFLFLDAVKSKDARRTTFLSAQITKTTA